MSDVMQPNGLQWRPPKWRSPRDFDSETSRRTTAEANEVMASAGIITLRKFVNLGWNVVEPARPFVPGWHIDAICDHLEAATSGHILRLLITLPPGMMKPNDVNSMVLTKRGRIKLGDVVVGDQILTHKGRFKKVLAVHVQGVLPLINVTTEHGRNNRTAHDHPYLTTRGWVQAQNLVVGDMLAAVTPIEEGFVDRVTPEEARLLGYLVGDGSCTHSPSFTNMDDDIIADFQRCAKACGFETGIKKTPPSRKDYKAKIIGLRGSLRWLERHGIRGRNSRTKRIPLDVLASSKNIIANFIGAYWSCDGQIVVRHTSQRGSTYFSNATTVGADLAVDLQHALLRLGINARVRTRSRIVNGDDYEYFMVHTCSHEDTVLFKDMPGLCEKKNRQLDGLSPRRFVQGPLFEDRIISIDRVPAGECRCLTVDDDASFTANDIAVHNSLLCSVFWNAWMWGPAAKPSMRFIGFSYDNALSIRDSVRTRRLIESNWYRGLWGDRFRLTSDQNQKLRYENDQTGFRIADYVGGGTGERGDFLSVDDPHNVKDGESDAMRVRSLNWLHETLPTRLNDPERTVIIVIMQRIHERDLAGEILSCDLGYEHLNLPMEFEPDRRCRTSIFVDPRKHAGDLLFPGRFPRDVVERDKKAMTEYAVAGQFQQRPVPRGGSFIKRHWFEIVGAAPGDCNWVRYWDLASTEGGGDFTVGVLMGYSPSAKTFYVADVKRAQLSGDGVKKLIKQQAQLDLMDLGKSRYSIWLPQDPGQAGKVLAKDMLTMLRGYDAHAEIESGDKETRALPFAAQAEAGNIKVIKAGWNNNYLDELAHFPTGRYKDQVDASSGAFGALIMHPKRRMIVGAVGGVV